MLVSSLKVDYTKSEATETTNDKCTDQCKNANERSQHTNREREQWRIEHSTFPHRDQRSLLLGLT